MQVSQRQRELRYKSKRGPLSPETYASFINNLRATLRAKRTSPPSHNNPADHGLSHLERAPQRTFEECWRRARDPNRRKIVSYDCKKLHP